MRDVEAVMSALVDSTHRQVGHCGPGRACPRGRIVPDSRRSTDSRRPPRCRRPVVAPLARPAIACDAGREPTWFSTIAIGVFVGLFVLVFGLIAGLSGVGAPLPATTKVVYVQPGENLWAIAQSAAPASAPDAVVQRIHELNGLGDSALHPGQALRVPDGERG